MSRPSSAQRLGRLLAIVPWVVAHDGPTVSEVCQRFDISERELLADLNMLFMCGVYPYTPDSLIEVDLDGGRVWVRFADWFRRPLRLTPPEGLALVAAARAMLGVPGAANGGAADNDNKSGGAGRGDGTDLGAGESNGPVPVAGQDHKGERTALASAVAKLEMVLGAGGDEALDIELGTASPDVLATLHAATDEHRKVLVEYYSFGRDQIGKRVVQPWRLFSSEGHWYLLAWCEKVEDKRLFRVDRVRSAHALGDRFEPPDSLGPVPIYEAGSDDPLVVLDVGPGAHWTLERYPNEGTVDLGESNFRVRLRVSSQAWLERLLLRAGPDVTVVSGAEGVAAAAARRILGVYGHVTSKE